MRKVCVLLLHLLLCFSADAQLLKMDDETTDVTFETTYLLSRLEGTIKGVKGTAELDTTKMENAFLRFSFSPATIIHNENYLGPDLNKECCFAAKNNPEVSLVSSSVSRLKGVNKYQFKGALIIKGKSRDITFPFTAFPNIGGYDFHFQFPIYKKTFDLSCAFHKKLIVKVRAYGKRV